MKSIMIKIQALGRANGQGEKKENKSVKEPSNFVFHDFSVYLITDTLNRMGGENLGCMRVCLKYTKKAHAIFNLHDQQIVPTWISSQIKNPDVPSGFFCC